MSVLSSQAQVELTIFLNGRIRWVKQIAAVIEFFHADDASGFQHAMGLTQSSYWFTQVTQHRGDEHGIERSVDERKRVDVCCFEADVAYVSFRGVLSGNDHVRLFNL